MITLILEGNDGAGKSSVAEALKQCLDKIGRKAEIIHFPTQWFYAMRDTIGPVTHFELVKLYLDDMLREVRTWEGRFSHTDTVMILDRFWPSTHVYNLYFAKHMSLTEREALLAVIKQLKDLVAKLSVQVRTYLLDVPFDVCKQRVIARGGDMDSYDEDSIETYKQRCKAYKLVLTTEPSVTTLTPVADDSPMDIAIDILRELHITNKGADVL